MEVPPCKNPSFTWRQWFSFQPLMRIKACLPMKLSARRRMLLLPSSNLCLLLKSVFLPRNIRIVSFKMLGGQDECPCCREKAKWPWAWDEDIWRCNVDLDTCSGLNMFDTRTDLYWLHRPVLWNLIPLGENVDLLRDHEGNITLPWIMEIILRVWMKIPGYKYYYHHSAVRLLLQQRLLRFLINQVHYEGQIQSKSRFQPKSETEK